MAATNEIDFAAIFDNLGNGVVGSNPISAIYNILPCYDNLQLLLRFQAQYFIEKYDLDDARALFDRIDKFLSTNKNLTRLGSKNLQNLLSAYTQNELVRGVKVNAINDVSDRSD